jgi:hypothetical protein
MPPERNQIIQRVHWDKSGSKVKATKARTSSLAVRYIKMHNAREQMNRPSCHL